MTTPAPTPTLPPTPRLAKDWIVEVDKSTTGTPDWTRVKAHTSINPTLETTKQDTTTFDSGMWKGFDWTTQIAWGLTGTVLRNQYADAEDPGQKIIRLAALPNEDGSPTVVHVRYYDAKGGPEAYEGFATVSWEPQSGGATDLQTANYTMSGGGERLDIANPLAG